MKKAEGRGSLESNNILSTTLHTPPPAKEKMGGNSSTANATIVNDVMNQFHADMTSNTTLAASQVVQANQSVSIILEGTGSQLNCGGNLIFQITSNADTKMITKFNVDNSATMASAISTALQNVVDQKTQSGPWGVLNNSTAITNIKNQIVNDTGMSALFNNLSTNLNNLQTSQGVTIKIVDGAKAIIGKDCSFYLSSVVKAQLAAMMAAVNSTDFSNSDITTAVNDAKQTASSGNLCGDCGDFGGIGSVIAIVAGVILGLGVLCGIGVAIFKLTKSGGGDPLQQQGTMGTDRPMQGMIDTPSLHSHDLGRFSSASAANLLDTTAESLGISPSGTIQQHLLPGWEGLTTIHSPPPP